MLFAKALCAMLVLSRTTFGESQREKNYDSSTVKRAPPRMTKKAETDLAGSK